MENKNKICNGYESNYTFLNDEDLEKHLETCESCAEEHREMQRISDLIKEAKPYFKERKKKANILKAACAMFVLFISGSCLSLFMSTGMYGDIIASHQPTASEMGLPVDEYGFLMVD